ncbi:MAG: hypothetical protein A2Z81_06505 [Omnitrophica WOR_2 bacterium GWA2_45_18]|nr:MAG: hypothetical protein A2Z81_06505 [Omnitrophica WOR_2 bacterium GWA2_45_18]
MTGNNHSRTTGCFQVMILLMIPLIIGGIAFKLKQATGPYWLGPNSDPSYIYLLNSLYIADHKTPKYIDHPGLPLQILGAGVIKAFSFHRDSPAMVRAVLTDPEHYLNVVSYVLVILYLVTLGLVGFYALKKTNNIVFALFVQIPSFLYLTLDAYQGSDVLPIIANVNAETLLITVGNLYGIGVLKLYSEARGEALRGSVQILGGVFLGILGGLGLATKFTFFPMLLVPFLLLKGVKAKGAFILSSVLTFFSALLPALPHWSRMFHWLKIVATDTAIYAKESKGLSDILHSSIQSVPWLVAENLFFVVSVMAGVIVFVWSLRSQPKSIAQPADQEDKILMRFLAVLCLAALVQILMVAERPASHYLTAAVGLCGLILGFIYLVVEKTAGIKKLPVTIVLIALILFHAGSAVWFQKRLKEVNREVYDFSRMVYTAYPNCIVCGYYRSSSKEYALNFGDENAGPRVYSDLLQELYPRAVFMQVFNGMFHNYKWNLDMEGLRKASACLLLYGSSDDFQRALLKTEHMASSRKEGLYRVQSFVPRQAIQYYYISEEFKSQGKYKEAYAFAQKAGFLGYPDLENYIHELRNLLIHTGDGDGGRLRTITQSVP